MRDIREQGAERDDELDVEVVREPDDLVRERAPAEIWLDSEQKHRVALEARHLGVVEGCLGPVDPPSDAVLESDLGTRGLEVEELLGVDVGEAAGVPRLREEARRERCALRAVVPAAEGCDEDGAAKSRAALDAEMRGDSGSLRSGLSATG